ncbi:hypothetical protein AB0J72_31455 [Dactylosporangium sp. NPDC049742]|uniref:hypothetical protein n=1 Tax=Dactylosporangium sp. NPDC049742 TaxID=3154737 RepID=UPI003440A85F
MAELTDLLDALAARPAPPHGLRADDLFTLGRRRRRRRRAGAVTGAALAVVVVLALVLAGAARWRPSGGTPVVGASSVAAPRAGAALSWAAVVDAAHAYATVPVCDPGERTCSARESILRGTDDGGRTWTDRGVVSARQVLTALGRDTLLAGDGEAPMRLSTDGGRHWADLPDGSAPVSAVPAGGAVVCRTPDMRQSCKLSAVDPQSRRIAPLTHQPDLIMATAYNVVDPAGQIQLAGDRIMVAGADRRTGRPAVAVSGDRGRTWSTHVFTDLPCPEPQDCGRDLPVVSVQARADGTTGFAVVVDTKERRAYVYFLLAGDGWARAGAAIGLDPSESFYRSFVTADNTHLMGLQSVPWDAPPRLRYVGLRAGAYEPVALDGLPATAMPVRRSVGGVFSAFDQPSGVLFQSADGRHFSPFPLG